MNILLLILLGVVGWMYNNYFGNNWHPQSDAEMVCDMLFAILAVLVVIAWKVSE